MKDYLRQLADDVGGDHRKGSVVREYLQARILQILQEDGVFTRWAFVGGTALRFLYSLPRFSEDLDFSTAAVYREPGFRRALGRVKGALEAEGYRLSIKLNDRKTVASAFVRFPGLPFELGLSPHPTQTLSIKLELDTNPPGGAVLETTLVRRHVTLNLQHHDRASLFAGKLHALLSRRWTKGRDLYDLIWYLADSAWPAPNLELLRSALAQTGWTGPTVTTENWPSVLENRLARLNWDRARADLGPFLERPQELELLTVENVTRLLRQRRLPSP